MAEVRWPHTRCVLCLEERPLNREHIIPQSIGGRLFSRFLCYCCNGTLGRSIDAEAKRDPSIQLAAMNLRQSIPRLTERILEDSKFIAKGLGGNVPGVVKRGEFQVNSAAQPDGSIVYPTPEFKKHIRQRLEKEGVPSEEVSDLIMAFDALPNNTRINFNDRTKVVRWDVAEIQPALDGPQLSGAVLTKIAYEFLACHAGEHILQSSPQLDAVRAAVRGQLTDVVRIERFRTSGYVPLHGLRMEPSDDHVIVCICLFGWNIYRVHLNHIWFPGPHYVYTSHLDSHEETCRPWSPQSTG